MLNSCNPCRAAKDDDAVRGAMRSRVSKAADNAAWPLLLGENSGPNRYSAECGHRGVLSDWSSTFAGLMRWGFTHSVCAVCPWMKGEVTPCSVSNRSRDPLRTNDCKLADVSIENLSTYVSRNLTDKEKDRLDSSTPDGTPRKLLDISRLTALGWAPRIMLHDGIASTYTWYA